MNETLREKEELSRVDSENLRKYRDEVAVLRKKVEQHNELMAEKDRTAQVSLEWNLFYDINSRGRGFTDLARRDQHSAARAEPNRGSEPELDQRQRKALAAVAGREAGGGEPYERSERVLRGHAIAAASGNELASGYK